MKKIILTPMILAAFMIPLSGQAVDRRADMIGNGDPSHGKCTMEVWVDGTADIRIRGNTASIRDLAGQQPQIRRFQCTGIMPPNPINFNFVGVDGRGRQELIQDPRNGGVAVVRVSDPDRGPETYTFDLIWDDDGGRNFRPDRDRDFDRFSRRERFTPDLAVLACQDSIRAEAMERFGNVNVRFRQTTPDNNPGRNDWVTGTIVVTRPWYSRNEVYRFSCSVDFENGRLRTAHIGVPSY